MERREDELKSTAHEQRFLRCATNLRSGLIVPSLLCLLMSALATIGPDTKSHRSLLSSSRIWTKSDWLIQEPEVTKMRVREAFVKEPPLRTTSYLKLVLVL